MTLENTLRLAVSSFLGGLLLTVWLAPALAGQTAGSPPPAILTAPESASSQTGAPTQQDQPSAQSEHERAERELKQEEHQRALGVLPEFATSNIPNAAALSPEQKWNLALKSATDPFEFVIAGLNAGAGQWQNSSPGYGQGAEGYFKRFGASYADIASSEMVAGFFFPTLLKEDPRYFRKGVGGFWRRLAWAISATVWTKNDSGTWGPNYANLAGNMAAAGLSNLYYPSTERGARPTFERALTVTGEGSIFNAFFEFWPDISRKFFGKKQQPGQAPQSKPN